MNEDGRANAPNLSKREVECIELSATGFRVAEIAEKLGITVRTVRMHHNEARRKLGANTKEHAVAKAIQFGVIKV